MDTGQLVFTKVVFTKPANRTTHRALPVCCRCLRVIIRYDVQLGGYLQKWWTVRQQNESLNHAVVFTGFLTGTLQNYARLYELPIDHLSFKYSVMTQYRDQKEVTEQMASLKFGEEIELDKEVCVGTVVLWQKVCVGTVVLWQEACVGTVVPWQEVCVGTVVLWQEVCAGKVLPQWRSVCSFSFYLAKDLFTGKGLPWQRGRSRYSFPVTKRCVQVQLYLVKEVHTDTVLTWWGGMCTFSSVLTKRYVQVSRT